MTPRVRKPGSACSERRRNRLDNSQLATSVTPHHRLSEPGPAGSQGPSGGQSLLFQRHLRGQLADHGDGGADPEAATRPGRRATQHSVDEQALVVQAAGSAVWTARLFAAAPRPTSQIQASIQSSRPGRSERSRRTWFGRRRNPSGERVAQAPGTKESPSLLGNTWLFRTATHAATAQQSLDHRVRPSVLPRRTFCSTRSAPIGLQRQRPGRRGRSPAGR